jgi:transcriptional regulator with XRE-family HTH domain
MRGLDLRLIRVAKRVKTKDVAERMGVPHSRISYLEAQPTVTETAASRYLAALATFDEPAVPA